MNIQYPENVVNNILRITLESQSFAYLAVDQAGVLINQGGDIAVMGLPTWREGDNLLDQAAFLNSLLPMSTAYEFLPTLQVTEGRVVDLHLFQDKDMVWIILVDKTDDFEWQSLARQKSNELRLLQQQMVKLQVSPKQDFTTDYLEALNILVLRSNEDESFTLLNSLPEAFSSIYPVAVENGSVLYPQQHFLFIDNFLVDARQVWESGNTQVRKRSGPWIEQSDQGEDLALEAIALNWQGERLLFIELLNENYQQHRDFLQIGREGSLIKNALEQEVRSRTQEIREREEEIALRLVCAADSRDEGETGSHIRRLGLYSELMAQHLGWSQQHIDEIRIAAPMHDIGKIGIPDHILKKPGKLTDDEFEIMKTHAEIGGNILSDSKSALVQMAREITIGHHERWDGSGYPYGLSGEEIAISARIVAIVDVFDALIHKRVYKEEMTIDQAIELMREGRGSHFDPGLFDLFVELRAEMAHIAHNFEESNSPKG